MATSIVNKNIPLINRKEWQFMTPSPTTTAAGMFFVTDQNEVDNVAMFVASSTVHYLYHHDEDAWVQVPSAALGGTFGAGSTGARSRFSSTITATGGTTTTITTTTSLSGLCVGKTIRFLSGANIGQESVVTALVTIPGGTNTITFSPAVTNAVANADTFNVDTGRFYIWNAGTMSATSYRVYDPLLGTWTSLVVTGTPGSWGTDGRLVSTPSNEVFATGSATSGSSNTVVNSTKTWTVNQWCNYQVRIVSGSGIGQVKTILSNTSTTLTTSGSSFSPVPDETSIYEITGNDDYLYLLGNNSVNMYRYSISNNSWSTLAPTTARTGAPAAGMGANWISKTGDAGWADENDIKDGRYIYSFRGGAGALLDRYDISGGTAGAGAWLPITYVGLVETFTTGTSYAADGRYIYIKKDATHRFFKYSVRGNYIEPVSTNLYPDGAGVLGDKLWLKKYQENGVTKLTWLYSLRNTGTELHRLLLF